MTTLSIFLFFFTLVLFSILLLIKGKEAWRAILGENGRLEISEFVVAVWIILYFPVAFAADLFLGYTLSSGMLVTMDGVMSFALGGSIVKEIRKSPSGTKSKENE